MMSRNANPNNPVLHAAIARRAARRPTNASKCTNQRISFDEALAYAVEKDRRRDEVQGYTASQAKSVRDRDNVWNLVSDDDEWLACVWVDADGRYHIARDFDPRTQQPIEVPHAEATLIANDALALQ